MTEEVQIFNRYQLSRHALPDYFSYVDENANLNFQNYLNLWSFNQQLQVLSAEDEEETLSKLNNMKLGQTISKFSAFGIMTLLYQQTNGFKTTIPWYFKYPRHIMCIGLGAIILPKHLIGNYFSSSFKYLEEQESKYQKQIEDNKQFIDSKIASFKNLEYVLNMFSQQNKNQNNSTTNI